MLVYIFENLRSSLLDFPLWTFVIILLTTLFISRWIQGKRRNYPPGPRGLPIVGYLPYLGDNDHLALDKLRKKYGDIFSMRWGIRDVVLLSNFKLIKEAFNKEEVSHRPPDLLSFTEKEGLDHIGTMNIKDWKESRRFMLSTLRTLGMGKNKVEEAIMEEIQGLTENLAKCVGQHKVNVRDYISPTINRVIISMICGRILGDNPEFSKIVDSFSRDVLEYVSDKSLGFYLPVLKPFISLLRPRIGKLRASIDEMEELMWKEISKHEHDIDKDTKDDYMDYFITEMRKNNTTNSGTLTHGVLNASSMMLLSAGTDTTLTAIEWMMLLMAKYPNAQERVYQEIVQVVGKERPPSWSDKDSLPYLDAVIAEASRINIIGPFGAAHWVGQDTKIGEYIIPRGTTIISNLYSVLMDPVLWNKPEEFIPERFLTADGKRAKDPEFFIPFGIGKRICAGEKLARMEVFLYSGAILQRFKILPPPGGVNMGSKLELVLHATDPVVRLEARS